MAKIDLSGTWQFQLVPPPEADQIDAAPASYAHTIELPGSLQAQGFGEEANLDTEWTTQIVGNHWVTDPRYAAHLRGGQLRMPFWLQPEKHFVGMAWYQKAVTIPPDWSGQRIILTLERPHIQTTIWLDGNKIGSQDTLAAPQIYYLLTNIHPGEHTLTIRVDNRLLTDIGTNSHSVTDHTQSNWNGIVGELSLQSVSPVWIEEVQAYPDIETRSVRLDIRLGNRGGTPGSGILTAEGLEHKVHWSEGGLETSIQYTLPADAQLWDEFTPTLHTVTLTIRGDLADHTRTLSLGLREVGVDRTQMTINGRKIFLRGTVECAVFPKTGYPATDLAEWTRILGICQSYGLNHVRFHSWCPPEAAFQAADALGIYLQVECSSWAQYSTTLGEGMLVDDWLYREGHAIVKAYGNHPSFMFLAYGNEPGGKFVEYLGSWVDYWKTKEPRRLHTGGAGWPVLSQNDFDNIPEPRIQQWMEGTRNRLDALPPSTMADYRTYVNHTPRPIVSHEIGERCVYPDFTEIPKYTGPLKARNFETFCETLEENHMGDQSAQFLLASGKLQILCYREEIESALRTKGFGGFQLLQANDFPGQGTALVGWLNPFWESKGYVTPSEFRRFNDATVLLARLRQRVFVLGETLTADIEIAHFGPEALSASVANWELVDGSGAAHRSGKLFVHEIPIGNGTSLGTIELPLTDLPTPAKYRLRLSLENSAIENDWELWLYPDLAIATPPPSVLITDSWIQAVSEATGGLKVLFIPPREHIQGEVGLGFSSIFWNTAWTSQQLPHTLGILCDPNNAAFANFPTEYHTNWQWWELIDRARPFIMNAFPAALRPTVQVIDDWFTNRRLGLLFEAKLGKGKLMVCGMDLTFTLYLRPAARQFRRSLLAYMDSDQFDPQHEIDESTLRSILKP